ncbi:hypothetical protein IT411_00810, partial [Candidatus Peregrinibacteria bacterium]|nr:hypothetical protein [Candidatus Peregrinibacteria bacterium]
MKKIAEGLDYSADKQVQPKNPTRVKALKTTFKLAVFASLMAGGVKVGTEFFPQNEVLGKMLDKKEDLTRKTVLSKKSAILRTLRANHYGLEVAIKDHIVTGKSRPIKVSLFKNDPASANLSMEIEGGIEFEGYNYLNNSHPDEGNVWFNHGNQILVKLNDSQKEADSLNCEKIGISSNRCVNGYYLFDFTENSGVIGDLKVSALAGDGSQPVYSSNPLNLTNKTALSSQIDLDDEEINMAIQDLVEHAAEIKRIRENPEQQPQKNGVKERIRDEQKIVALAIEWLMGDKKTEILCAGFISGVDTLVTAGHCLKSPTAEGKLTGV